MKTYIDWKLFNKGNLLVCRKNVVAQQDKIGNIIYETEKEYNKINTINKIFIRKTSDMEMEIDFNKKTCKFNFEEIGNCKFDINCKFVYKKDIINLFYNIDDEEKKVEIVLKNMVM